MDCSKSKIFQAIVEVSMGGIRPFTEGAVANYMNMQQQSIKKGIIRMKRKKLIEPIGFGLYVMSESGIENELAKIKQEKVLTLIRGTGKSLFLIWK